MTVVYALIGLVLFIAIIKGIGAMARGAWHAVPTTNHIARAIHDASPDHRFSEPDHERARRAGQQAMARNQPGNPEFDADERALQEAFKATGEDTTP